MYDPINSLLLRLFRHNFASKCLPDERRHEVRMVLCFHPLLPIYLYYKDPKKLKIISTKKNLPHPITADPRCRLKRCDQKLDRRLVVKNRMKQIVSAKSGCFFSPRSLRTRPPYLLGASVPVDYASCDPVCVFFNTRRMGRRRRLAFALQ